MAEVEARGFYTEAKKFRVSLEDDGHPYAGTCAALDALFFAMENEFELSKQPGPKRGNSSSRAAELKRLKRTVRQQREQLDEMVSQKTSGRLGHVWLIRAGLSNPCIPPTTVNEFCRDFLVDEEHPISCFSISRARNAFSELIKMFNRRAIQHVGQGLWQDGRHATTEAVFIRIVQDEAAMRAL